MKRRCPKNVQKRGQSGIKAALQGVLFCVTDGQNKPILLIINILQNSTLRGGKSYFLQTLHTKSYLKV